MKKKLTKQEIIEILERKMEDLTDRCINIKSYINNENEEDLEEDKEFMSFLRGKYRIYQDWLDDIVLLLDACKNGKEI